MRSVKALLFVVIEVYTLTGRPLPEMMPSVLTEEAEIIQIEETLTDAPEEDAGPTVGSYVLNTNTYRFHKPSCESVYEMKEKNREWFYGSREEIIEAGYIPCGRCRP